MIESNNQYKVKPSRRNMLKNTYLKFLKQNKNLNNNQNPNQKNIILYAIIISEIFRSYFKKYT